MYNLVFSDGTGQRGVRKDGSSTNVHKLFVAARRVGPQTCFYDAGVGADPEKSHGIGRWFKNLAAKATGLGITENIRDCYDFLIRAQQPDRPIGLFGFSRGAYTVRSVGGVLTLCGIPAADQDGIDLTVENDPQSMVRRAELVKEAVKIYQTKSGGDGPESRKKMAENYREKYRCAEANLKVIGVFDTVAALGLPGVMNVFNPLKHAFHDQFLSEKVPFGFQALAVDENREVFKPVLWEEVPPGVDQVIDQQWFPGVHSDVGGGYHDPRLSDFSLMWMAEQCKRDGVAINFDFGPDSLHPDVLGTQHDERTGLGKFWSEGTREAFVRTFAVDDHQLCDPIEARYKAPHLDYRPRALHKHPRVLPFYG